MTEDIMMRIQDGFITIADVLTQYGQEVYDLVASML